MIERSSADPGAPVLSGDKDSLRRVFRAVLVDGYGTQPGLGWTVAYESVGSPTQSGKAFFRSPTVAGRPPYYIVVAQSAQMDPLLGVASSTTGLDDYRDTVLTGVIWPYPSTVTFADWRFTISDDARFLSFQMWDGDTISPGVIVVRFGDFMVNVLDGSVNTRNVAYLEYESSDYVYILFPKDPFYGLYKTGLNFLPSSQDNLLIELEGGVSRVPTFVGFVHGCPWMLPHVFRITQNDSVNWLSADQFEIQVGLELYIRPSGRRVTVLKLGGL